MFEGLQITEVLTWLVGTSSLVFVLCSKRVALHTPNAHILLLSYIFLLVGWTLTIIEEWGFHVALNVLEHCCYTISSIVLLYWVVSAKREGDTQE